MNKLVGNTPMIKINYEIDGNIVLTLPVTIGSLI